MLSQINERVLESEINTLVYSVNHAYSKDISSGTRTFLLSLKKDDGVSAYCRSRLEAELLGALNGTKFEVVFQPFLQEKTLKYVESTDTLNVFQGFFLQKCLKNDFKLSPVQRASNLSL